jgi:murein DD-endopeptidase MepM/ murein hydrolase activator NlpD
VVVRRALGVRVERTLRTVTSSLLVLVVSIVPTAARAAPAGASRAAPAGAWRAPVDAPVVRGFEPPRTRFGPGHLGIDYAVGPGSAVRAVGDGVVTFAGSVAGTRHVVVSHGDLRTSLSFLATVTVRRGQRVAAGDVVGTSGGTGPGHDGSVVHLGLRRGERYLDPAALFAPPDLARAVRLVPLHDVPARLATEAEERRGLLESLGSGAGGVLGSVGRGVRALTGAGRRGLDAALDAAGALERFARDVAEPAAAALRDGAATLAELAARLRSLAPVPLGPELFLDGARAVRRWLEERRHCDPDAPGADGTGGSTHGALLVAGLGSRGSASEPTVALPVERLGYDPADVSSFSYADDGGHYDADDTYVAIEDAARRLARQLRARQRAEPGREVDLLAHSQGGVVVTAFLALVYDPSDPSYPPLGTVVTLAAPHGGAPAADLGAFFARTPAGAALLAGAAAGTDVLPPPDAAALHELGESSGVLGRLDRARLPEQVDLTTIGAALDYVVPATHAARDGAAHVVVNPWSARAHSAVLTDREALRAVRAALEGGDLPCQSFLTHVVGAVAPTVITRVERGAGVLLAGTPGVPLP